jgi:flagellar hook assembly protein FlgD
MGFVGISTNTNEIPENYSLEQNYPNPFNPSTNINFKLPESGLVNISIYDINGKLVEELINRNLSAGNHLIDWNAINYPSGIYFYRISAGNFTDVKKMILVK